MAAARDTIERTEIIRLSSEDQVRFVESLLTPSDPAPAMAHVRDHHRRLVGES